MNANYEIEIWDKSGKPLADIYKYCSGFSWSKELNGSETVSFTIDLNKFEEVLRALGFSNDPYGLLDVGHHDIRIKRNGTYIVGCNVYKFTYNTEDPTITMMVECVGYLNFYKTQYITADFENVNQEDILWGAINLCNQKDGGDYGVRQGTHTGAHVQRIRHYTRKEVASLIQQMSNVINGCDFSFTPDKLFNTYEVKGTYRPSVRLTYPGNIQSFSFSRSIAKTANFIYGIGSGNGEDAVQSTAEDAASENCIYRREKIITWNSVTLQNTLDDHTNAALHLIKDAIELPSITLRPGSIDLSQVDVGDTVILEITSNLSLKHINGDYRIKTISCAVDETGSEMVQIGFDDLDIDTIVANQESETEE